MRLTSRLLATAKYLSPGAPTGLTGVYTHPAPRTTLLYLYTNTLDKLKQFPEHSVYRQSVEALTKHRLSIVESVKPSGLEQWQNSVRQTIESHPQAFRQIPASTNPKEVNIIYREIVIAQDYDIVPPSQPQPEGPRVAAEKAHQGEVFTRDPKAESITIPRIEPEPPLSVEQ